MVEVEARAIDVSWWWCGGIHGAQWLAASFTMQAEDMTLFGATITYR
jgi:hypothetical protein